MVLNSERPIFDSSFKPKETMTTIKINPTVKNEIQNSFGINPISELMIKTYEGVYNLAFNEGKSLDEGHEIAMSSLIKLSEMISKNNLSFTI